MHAPPRFALIDFRNVALEANQRVVPFEIRCGSYRTVNTELRKAIFCPFVCKALRNLSEAGMDSKRSFAFVKVPTGTFKSPYMEGSEKVDRK